MDLSEGKGWTCSFFWGRFWAFDSVISVEVQSGMPKKKTKKAAAKRFKKSAHGKILFAKAGKGHLLSSKSRKRKRNLRRKGVLADAEVKRITNLLAG